MCQAVKRQMVTCAVFWWGNSIQGRKISDRKDISLHRLTADKKILKPI